MFYHDDAEMQNGGNGEEGSGLLDATWGTITPSLPIPNRRPHAARYRAIRAQGDSLTSLTPHPDHISIGDPRTSGTLTLPTLVGIG